jgi:phage-related protein
MPGSHRLAPTGSRFQPHAVLTAPHTPGDRRSSSVVHRPLPFTDTLTCLPVAYKMLAFPKDARKEAGFQLGKVQAGLEPADWKPFDDVGAGTREIRIRDATGIERVMYIAKFEEAIYVLHCFHKKTQLTSKQDRAIAAARYRAVVSARKEKK